MYFLTTIVSGDSSYCCHFIDKIFNKLCGKFCQSGDIPKRILRHQEPVDIHSYNCSESV